MKPYHRSNAATLYQGDCMDVMPHLEASIFHAVITDPPYGLGFQGEQWDNLPPGREWAEACRRVLKPGGYLLAFGATRTWHKLVGSVEEAGLEVRDTIAWLHGQGMPKGKQQLKPAFEPILVARNPLTATAAAATAQYGTGMRIDACRLPLTGERYNTAAGSSGFASGYMRGSGRGTPSVGRWPTNVLVDDSQAEALGHAARFFPTFRFEPKAPASERPEVNGVIHPTVKPLALMRWLVKLTAPNQGLVLDPFAGSGATVEACLLEGVRCVAIEKDQRYLPLIEARIRRTADRQPDLFTSGGDAA